MGARVAVAGASGYAGGELLRLLAGHPGLEIAAVTAGASAGRTVAELHPHLAGLPAVGALTLQPHGPAALSDCDLVFLALPAGESAAVADAAPHGAGIVDLGPDFRLADPSAWDRHYASPHAGRWVTGLPELPGARAAIRTARRVAAPGCYATAAMLALVPLAGAGLADPGDVVVVAASGTSGAGRSLRYRSARQRGDGIGLGLRRRGRAPAHARDRAGTGRGDGARDRGRHRCRVRAGRPGELHAGSRADAARHPGYLHRPADPRRDQHRRSASGARRGVRGRAFRHRAPGRRLAGDGLGGRAPTARTCKRLSTSGRAAPSSSPRSTTSARAPPGRRSRTPT